MLNKINYMYVYLNCSYKIKQVQTSMKVKNQVTIATGVTKVSH